MLARRIVDKTNDVCLINTILYLCWSVFVRFLYNDEKFYVPHRDLVNFVKCMK